MVAKKILIIDDDPVFCFILEKLLPKDLIPSTKIFNKAKEALSYIVKENAVNTKFLIFLDLNMPLINGLEFLDAIKGFKQAYDFKVVILTSSINPEDEAKSSSYLEVIDFLEKPIVKKDLQKILDTY